MDMADTTGTDDGDTDHGRELLTMTSSLMRPVVRPDLSASLSADLVNVSTLISPWLTRIRSATRAERPLTGTFSRSGADRESDHYLL
jgi:hypothetical protein